MGTDYPRFEILGTRGHLISISFVVSIVSVRASTEGHMGGKHSRCVRSYDLRKRREKVGATPSPRGVAPMTVSEGGGGVSGE